MRLNKVQVQIQSTVVWYLNFLLKSDAKHNYSLFEVYYKNNLCA